VSRAILAGRPGRRLVPGLLARLILVILVVGVPVALSTVAGGPSFHLELGGLWRAALLHRPGDAQVVAGWLGRAAVLMAWVGWAWLTICVVLETRAWLTGRSTVRLPASRSLQWMAAVLVGTAFAVGTAGRTPAHHITSGGIHASPARDVRLATSLPGGGPVVHPGNLPAQAGTGVRGHSVLRTLSDGLPVRPSEDLQPVPVDTFTNPAVLSVVGAAPPGRHRVSPRETLWSIAESRLGQARRWREIADLNYDVVQADGSRLAADHWIQPGWELVLPSAGGTVTTGSPPRSVEAPPAVEAPSDHVALTTEPPGDSHHRAPRWSRSVPGSSASVSPISSTGSAASSSAIAPWAPGSGFPSRRFGPWSSAYGLVAAAPN
jgi:hypothetical protein